MDTGKNLLNTLKIISELFKKKNISFALAGGLAVGILSRPRATEDIDLIIMISDNDRQRIVNILSDEFKIINAHTEIMHFKNADIWRVIIANEETSGNNIVIIDFIIAVNDICKNAIERRFFIEIDSIEIPIVTIEDLILLKLLSNRDIDRMDINYILKDSQKGDLNFIYLKDQINNNNLNIQAKDFFCKILM